jgi:hypothetical protein
MWDSQVLIKITPCRLVNSNSRIFSPHGVTSQKTWVLQHERAQNYTSWFYWTMICSLIFCCQGHLKWQFSMATTVCTTITSRMGEKIRRGGEWVVPIHIFPEHRQHALRPWSGLISVVKTTEESAVTTLYQKRAWIVKANRYITTNSRNKMFYSDGQDTRGIVSILYNY